MARLRILCALGLCLSLQGCGSGKGPVSYDEFAVPVDAKAAVNSFSGRLVSAGSRDTNFTLRRDTLDLADLDLAGIRDLPPFDMGFVQHGDRLLPVEQGPVANDHNWWEWVFAPGAVWNEVVDSDYSQAAMPFALKEKNEDCIHDGVMRFQFNDVGDMSDIRFQISAQTCLYLQFEMWGTFAADYVRQEMPEKGAIIAEFQREWSTRVEARPINALTGAFPDADPAVFGPPPGTYVGDETTYGFIIDGIHYQGGCSTERGNYPFCDELALPSYSTAKSLVGGLAVMRAEFVQPGILDSPIAVYVPECKEGWDGVSIEHALDMTTGHYDSKEVAADEDALLGSPFFLSLTHAEKISAACNLYARKEFPGTTWVYHTPDTYLVGVALNRWIKERKGPDADLYEDLVVEPLWIPLSLGSSIHKTRRTLDEVAQPFTAYGLTYYRNDVAKIAQFLGPDDGRIHGEDVLDRKMFDAVKGRVADDMGLIADYQTMRYNNGFRIRDVSAELGCDEPVWITNLSGFGGINIILMPNDTAYYRFGDDGVHRYIDAVIESHRIRPMCD